MGNRPEDHARLAELWADHAARVEAFAARQVGADAAQDVLSETFLVAWRRLADVPEPALPWLLVTARNVMRNHRRSVRRRDALGLELVHLRETLGPATPEDRVLERDALVAALARLTPPLREALLLTGWDGLSGDDAARVAGCLPATFRLRLSRARRRLAELVDEDPASAPGSVDGVVTGRRA